MTIADKLTLLEQTKEAQRVKLGLPKSLPFSEYVKYIPKIPFDLNFLFLNGEQGVGFRTHDLSKMFQDVQGSIPVTKDGDPVALIRDISGNNNHLTQSTASARPIYRTDGELHWLEFDGVDDMFTLSKPIDMSNGTMAIACESAFWRIRTIISQGVQGYLAIHSTGYWSRNDANLFSLSNVMHQKRQSVVARINNNTTMFVSSDGQSGTSTTNSGGLSSTQFLFGFSGAGGTPFRGRVYGFVMLTSSVSDETSKEILTYLDKVSGIKL